VVDTDHAPSQAQTSPRYFTHVAMAGACCPSVADHALACIALPDRWQEAPELTRLRNGRLDIEHLGRNRLSTAGA
jgi:hypothetical protein